MWQDDLITLAASHACPVMMSSSAGPVIESQTADKPGEHLSMRNVKARSDLVQERPWRVQGDLWREGLLCRDEGRGAHGVPFLQRKLAVQGGSSLCIIIIDWYDSTPVTPKPTAA